MSIKIHSEFICREGEDFFQRLIADIEQAQSFIECEVYILENDKTGRSIIDSLSAASQRGVSVRLIVDGIGTSPWIQGMLNRLKASGGEVKIYHPLPWRFWQWGMAIKQEGFLTRFFFLLSVINSRNHRKTCIIDSWVHWIGSFNFSSTHLHSDQGGENWRDTAIRLETDNDEVHQAFQRIWQRTHSIRPRLPEGFPGYFRINDSRRKRRLLYRDLLGHLTRAHSRIWITTPYFIPGPRLQKRLRNAAKKGVDVRLLLPSVSDVFFMPWASLFFYQQLLKAGVKVYEYQAGILHAKTLIVDYWATIGSSNMNSRSILHDLEIDYVLQKHSSLEQLENHFLDDLKQSKQIAIEDIQKRKPIIKLLGRLALSLRYWL